jgi:WD40 repeat protein
MTDPRATVFISYRVHASWVRSCAFARERALVVTAGGDGVLRLLDPEQDAPVAVWRHPQRIRTAAIAPDGGMVASGSPDGLLRLFAPDQPHDVRRFATTGEIWSTTFSPCGRLVVAGTDDRLPAGARALVGDVASGEVIAEIDHPDMIRFCTFTPDGSYLS